MIAAFAVAVYYLAMANQSDVNKVSNPAYVNIAPCPCDLMPGACDVNCCCDSVSFSVHLHFCLYLANHT